MIIIPINGKNERMGSLFKTPKHLLLYRGVPAIISTVNYLKKNFDDDITILTNDLYIDGLSGINVNIINVGETESQVDTLRKYTNDFFSGGVMFIDCDIIPIRIGVPKFNTVYGFENKTQDKQYSNYSVINKVITDCNEKEFVCQFAGGGIYYFENINEFNQLSIGKTNISMVVKSMIDIGKVFYFNDDNEIFRFGTLKDIIT